jgi:peptide/nickel transport system substrate-binding protein
MAIHQCFGALTGADFCARLGIMKKIRKPILAMAFSSLLAISAYATPKHGIAMLGEPVLQPDFKNLPYANPDAPQGGILKQAVTGTFDSINPFIIKGNPPASNVNPRTYVFESLMGRSGAEPFTEYGLLAESIDVTDDRQTFTFKIRPEAKFSDGSPVTSADVQYSLETLRDHGRPGFKNNFSKITKMDIVDDHTITFHQDKGDRELPMIIGLMSILSKKSWEGKNFEDTTVSPIIGSGPYVFGDIKPGETVSYKKNPNYWGKNLPFNKGLWNFDQFRFDYFKDANAAFEAFKKGDADIRSEGDSTRWTTGYKFPAVSEGKVLLETYEAKTPAPASGFVFNTRRKIFDDVKVREALTMAFDFEWANANLFNGSYKRVFGYFSGSELSSLGKPTDAVEQSIIGTGLRNDMMDGSYKLPITDGSGRDRKVLKKAVDLLADAGWKVSDQGLLNAAGEQFAFTLTIQSPEQEKIALHYQRTLQQIGIKIDIRTVDDAQFNAVRKTYDYDMIPWTYYNSLSPGNEQEQYFGSSGKKTEGTRNYAGVADPKVDAAIQAMLKSKTREEFVSAIHAEDRLLVSGFYMVPFYSAPQWVARWSYIGSNLPDKQPVTGFESITLWRNP